MSYSCFTLEIAEGVAHLRFSRPDKFNSFTPDFWRELPDAVNDISGNAKARVIVLSAEGKHFTAGMDTFRCSCRAPWTRRRTTAKPPPRPSAIR